MDKVTMLAYDFGDAQRPFTPEADSMGDDTVRLNYEDPATKLKERIQIGDLIEEGGFGEVVEATDRNLNRRQALKRLKKELEKTPRERRAIIKEAQIMAQLSHQCIVPVFELGIDRGKLFFTMQRVFGETLKEKTVKYFKKRDDKKLRALLEAFIKACDAVAFAHSRGILHGDIKPDNIMIGDFGEVYLVDWGSAKLKNEPKLTIKEKRRLGIFGRRRYDQDDDGEIISGTLHYMPVELAKGHPFDERSDIFCLGGVLYYLLTNRAPFIGEGKAELIEQIRAAHIDDPREVTSHHVYPRLAEIAMKALSESPAKRHQSVNALKRAVSAFLHGDWNFDKKHFKVGSVIARQGDLDDCAYIVEKGRCAVFRQEDGVEVFLRHLTVDDVFGEMELFSERPRTSTVMAETDVTLKVVKKEIFDEHFKDDIGMGYWVGLFMKAMSDRFFEKDKRLSELESRMRKLGQSMPE
jgi:serine/threonine protein kinase